MPKKSIDKFEKIHKKLADQFKTDYHIIAFIRGVANEKHLKQKELLDWLIEKLTHSLLPQQRISIYKNRLTFIGNLSEKDFEYIVTYHKEP